MAIDPIYSDAARRGEDATLTEGWRNYGSITDMALASFGQSSLSLGTGIALTGAGVADLVGDEETQGALLKNVAQLNNARQKLLNYDDVGLAGNIWSAFWGLAPHLAVGAISPLAPAITMGLSQLPTGLDLINKGVDTETAGTVAGLSMAASAAQALLPMAGTTLAKTAGLATGTVALGVAERKTMREILKQSGYINEAQMFDPFDKHAMPVDMVMALTFGALGMRKFKALKKAFSDAQMGAAIDIQKLKDNKELMDYLSNKEFMEDFRQLAPEAKDAYSALDSYQNMIKNMPFDHKAPGELQKHMNALYKAMDDIVNGRPVDVSGEIKTEISPAPQELQLLSYEPGAKTPEYPSVRIYREDLIAAEKKEAKDLLEYLYSKEFELDKKAAKDKTAYRTKSIAVEDRITQYINSINDIQFTTKEEVSKVISNLESIKSKTPMDELINKKIKGLEDESKNLKSEADIKIEQEKKEKKINDYWEKAKANLEAISKGEDKPYPKLPDYATWARRNKIIEPNRQIKKVVDDTVKDTVARAEQEIVPNLSQEAHADLLFEKLTPIDKIGNITREKLGTMLREVNPDVIAEIKNSKESGQLTTAKLQDTVRNEMLKQIGEGKDKAERDSIKAKIAEIEPEINKILSGKEEGTKQYLPDNPVLEQSGEAILKNKPDLTITEDSETGARTIKASDAIAEYKAAIDREVAKKDLYNKAIRCILFMGGE